MEEKEELNCTHSCATCGGCGHDHDHMEEEIETGILTFVDDDGNDVRFEILDVVITYNIFSIKANPNETNAQYTNPSYNSSNSRFFFSEISF